MSAREKTPHDELFKNLLQSCFKDFIKGFFPEVYKELNFKKFGPDNFLSQEQFGEIVGGKLHKPDIVAQVPVKDGKTYYVIILVEAQHSKRKEFLSRIFKYFALLHIKFGTVVIPIAIYTDEAKWEVTEAWQTYKMEFAGHRFLDFRFLTLKLKNLKVRQYLRSTNPATLALAAKMDLSGEDVAKIKTDLLRKLYNTVRKNGLFYQLGVFLDSYIDDKDNAVFRKEIEEIRRIRKGKEGKEVGRLIEYLTQGSHGKGLKEGLKEGLEKGLEKARLQDAEKMSNRKLDWELITDITGVTPKSLAKWIKGGRK